MSYLMPSTRLASNKYKFLFIAFSFLHLSLLGFKAFKFCNRRLHSFCHLGWPQHSAPSQSPSLTTHLFNPHFLLLVRPPAHNTSNHMLQKILLSPDQSAPAPIYFIQTKKHMRTIILTPLCIRLLHIRSFEFPSQEPTIYL